MLDHLETPAVYDNAGGSNAYGQTFVAVDAQLESARFYISDPSRPGNPTVNQLVGPAELRVYQAANLTQPIELARIQVVDPQAVVEGLVTFHFAQPVATEVGVRHYIGIFAADGFGLGMRSQFVSTYAGGSEALYDVSSATVVENASGRDLSFQLLPASAPVPAGGFAAVVFMALTLLVLGAVGARAAKTQVPEV